MLITQLNDYNRIFSPRGDCLAITIAIIIIVSVIVAAAGPNSGIAFWKSSCYDSGTPRQQRLRFLAKGGKQSSTFSLRPSVHLQLPP